MIEKFSSPFRLSKLKFEKSKKFSIKIRSLRKMSLMEANIGANTVFLILVHKSTSVKNFVNKKSKFSINLAQIKSIFLNIAINI